MNRSVWLKQFTVIAMAVIASACARPTPQPAPTSTATPGPTATPTSTPTPTPTPTPTALPLTILDDLRDIRLTTPIPQRGAPCGVVDVLDFPVGPPDGRGFAARWSFGRNSGRYNGIHAGEDWVRSNGDSLGQPVYSVGHGTVTYAQPLGWGVDRGVVIVRHLFPDGGTILSFYGHLDPDSVELRPGDCVARGDQVGAIGKPRGRPHLHFEVRNHTPDDPGPGYWPVDPRLAGWQPPSEYIWTYRIATAPGVQWTRPFTATASTGIGLLSDGALAALDGQRLIVVDPNDGSLRWSRPVSGTILSSVVDASGSAIYLSRQGGAVEAVDASGETVWQAQFATRARPYLLPLPGSGVVVHNENRLLGIGTDAKRLWLIQNVAPPFDWTLDGDRLIFTTVAQQPTLYALDRSGRLLAGASIGGRPVVSGDRMFLYNPNGIYQIDPGTLTARLLKPLDPSVFEIGTIAALPDGGVVVSHRGEFARRLIALDADGSLRWDWAIAGLGTTMPRLLANGDRVYAIAQDGDVLSIDLASGAARRVFDGGSAIGLEGSPWAAFTPDGRLLFDFRGGNIVALDPEAAMEVIVGAH
ncbi:MAG TPA: PQQ-binding-like beta-propeller repeat protein [Anaerolineae bacterium]|nr:PQQ-binding-like beta-propeller repeat protein [Anaerolineae bacterium]